MGQIIVGRYKLIEPIFEHGLRTTHHALHVQQQEPILLTTIQAQAGTTLNQLRKRAKASSQLKHPYLISAIDYGLATAESFYYTHRYHRTYSLDHFLRSLPPEEASFAALRIMIQATEALLYIHQAGSTHRDIQPVHLRINEKGQLRLDGYINARLRTEAPSRLRSAHQPYLAPELLGGKAQDKKTDLYSLGAVFFYCLTGSSPYSSNQAKLEDHFACDSIMEALQRVSVDKEISSIILRCLSSRKLRFQSTEDLLSALEKAYSKRPIKMKLGDLSSSWKRLFSLPN